jgi:hypothetical protein
MTWRLSERSTVLPASRQADWYEQDVLNRLETCGVKVHDEIPVPAQAGHVPVRRVPSLELEVKLRRTVYSQDPGVMACECGAWMLVPTTPGRVTVVR